MQEIWKEIKGYEGLYEISNYGRVKSLSRIVKNQSGPYTVKERILSTNKTNGRNYKIISLSKNGIAKNHYIHRLVATGFIDNPNNYPQVNHKDEDATNNNVMNLEWCDAKYNVNYGTCRERTSKKLRNNKKMSRPIKMYDALTMEFICDYPSISECARQLKTSTQGISSVLYGIQHKHKGYFFEYSNN